MKRLRFPEDFHYCDEWGEHDRSPFMEEGLKVYEIAGCGCHCCRTLRVQFDSHRQLALADRARRFAKRQQEFRENVEPNEYHRMKTARDLLQETFGEWLPATVVWEH